MTVAYGLLILHTAWLWDPALFSGTKATGTEPAMSTLLNIFHHPEKASLPQTDLRLAPGPALLPEPKQSYVGMPVP